MAHLDWIARQDGFAGKLLVSDGVFEWRRDIDFQPAGPIPDRGRLIRDGDLMIEEGYHSSYIEHWHPELNIRTPAYALRLRDSVNGCAGRIVRVGTVFMYARGRVAGLPRAPDLAGCIAGAGSLAEAQDMADCEISFGSVSGAGWTIVQSTLPFRQGRELGLRLSTDRRRARTMDLAADGRQAPRSWAVTAIEGRPSLGADGRLADALAIG